MSKFGWSLPPGCGTLPGEEPDRPCELCGLFPDDCKCPECPECGEFGNPDCYIGVMPDKQGHGMVRSPEQIASLASEEAKWIEEGARVAEAEAHMEEEWEASLNASFEEPNCLLDAQNATKEEE